MNIILLNRKYNPKERSIERLFDFLKEGFTKKGITISEIENPYQDGLFNLLKSILFFRKKIDKNQCVHITGQIHFAAILLNTTKIIITVHDLGLYRKLSPLRFFVFKLFWIYLPFRKAKKIIAISEKTKREIIEIMPSVSDKVEIIPNCITIPIETEIYLKNNEVSQILIVGTRNNKNIEKGIMALRDLPIQLTIVGGLSDEQKQVLQENRIAYKNEVEISEKRLLSLYKQADILLFPSIYEGFGLPILEAQAQNVMVITSAISPMKEVAGQGAILVNPNDEKDIRNALENILNLTQEEKIQLLRKGKNNLKNYTIDTIAEKYLKVYNQVSKI